MIADAYPLQWPHWIKRTTRREPARFQSHGVAVSVHVACERVTQQLRLLGANSPVVSTNMELRRDGLPRSGRDPDDCGAAVYFLLAGKQMCMPCDKWDRLADNIAAIAAHIDAVRRIERYGVQSVEEAFSGFVALPPPMGWREILGVSQTAGIEDVEVTFKRLAAQHHPDRGGSHVRMAEISAARDAARRELQTPN